MPTKVVVHSTFKRFLQVIGFAILIAAALTGLKKLAKLRNASLDPPVTETQDSLTSVPSGTNLITGLGTIIDADTIEILGTRIRLEGIDAAEESQSCGQHGQEWPCGREAEVALIRWIDKRPISCRISGSDRYQRKLARCFVDDDDIQRWLVTNGWALASRRYSMDYVPDEQRASLAKAGMWRTEFVAPWDWRKQSEHSTE